MSLDEPDIAESLAGLMKVLSYPARIRIVSLIATRGREIDEAREKKTRRPEPMTVGELTRQMGSLSQPTISHHLRILREAGLVIVTKVADHGLLELNPDVFAEVCRLLYVFVEAKPTSS